MKNAWWLAGWGPRTPGVRGPRHRHGVGVDNSGPGMLSRGPGRRRHGLLGRRRVVDALAVVAATTASTLAAAVPTVAPRGRRSGRARGGGGRGGGGGGGGGVERARAEPPSPPPPPAAVGKDALSAGPKGGGRLLGRVVGSRGTGWKTPRRGCGHTGGEASDESGVSRMSPKVF
jgi:hypothetical protein